LIARTGSGDSYAGRVGWELGEKPFPRVGIERVAGRRAAGPRVDPHLITVFDPESSFHVSSSSVPSAVATGFEGVAGGVVQAVFDGDDSPVTLNATTR